MTGHRWKYPGLVSTVVLLLLTASKPLFAGEIRVAADRPNPQLENPLDTAKQLSPRSAIGRSPRTTTDGVLALNEPIAVKLNGAILHIPAAYLSPWPRAQDRDRVHEMGSLRFEFWMPDRRYLEISPISNASFRPREPGHEEPTENTYIVRVWDLRPVALNEPGYVSPEQAFQNQIRNNYPSGESAFSFHDEEFDLVQFWPGRAPRADGRTEYRHKNGSDPQILLDCVPPTRFGINPYCAGRVHLASEDLALFVVFPQEELPHWRDIILAARDLYNSWKQPP